jgi:hypothetical protein
MIDEERIDQEKADHELVTRKILDRKMKREVKAKLEATQKAEMNQINTRNTLKAIIRINGAPKVEVDGQLLLDAKIFSDAFVEFYSMHQSLISGEGRDSTNIRRMGVDLCEKYYTFLRQLYNKLKHIESYDGLFSVLLKTMNITVFDNDLMYHSYDRISRRDFYFNIGDGIGEGVKEASDLIYMCEVLRLTTRWLSGADGGQHDDGTFGINQDHWYKLDRDTIRGLMYTVRAYLATHPVPDDENIDNTIQESSNSAEGVSNPVNSGDALGIENNNDTKGGAKSVVSEATAKNDNGTALNTKPGDKLFSVRDWATIFYYADDACCVSEIEQLIDRIKKFKVDNGVDTSNEYFKKQYYAVRTRDIENCKRPAEVIKSLKAVEPYLAYSYPRAVARLRNDIELAKSSKANM